MISVIKRVAPVLTALALAACAGSAAAGHPHPDEEGASAKKTQERGEWKVKSKGEGRHVIVDRSSDGDSHVVIDGKTIEGKVKVVQEDGVLIIMNGDGDVLRKIDMPEMPGNFAFRFNDDGDLNFSDGSNWQFSDDTSFEFKGSPKGRAILGVEVGEDDGNIIVHRVIEDGPAALAGLQSADILIRIDNLEISGLDGLRGILGEHGAGDDVKVWVMRGDDERSFEVKMGTAKGNVGFPGESGNFRVFFDEDRAEALHMRSKELYGKAQEKARVHFQEWKGANEDAEGNYRIAVELKEKLRHLDKNNRKQIEIHMKRANKALLELQELDFDFDMPEIEILDLDGDSMRIVVVPTPERHRIEAIELHAKELPLDKKHKELQHRAKLHVQKLHEQAQGHKEQRHKAELHVKKLHRATEGHKGEVRTWSDDDSRMERLEMRVEKIEALVEKILQKLDERNG